MDHMQLVVSNIRPYSQGLVSSIAVHAEVQTVAKQRKNVILGRSTETDRPFTKSSVRGLLELDLGGLKSVRFMKWGCS